MARVSREKSRQLELPPTLGGELAPRAGVMDEEPHSHRLRSHRRMDGPGTFFVTKCLQPRLPLLCEPARASTGGASSTWEAAPAGDSPPTWEAAPAGDSLADVIVGSLGYMVESQRINLGAFVVMPDHWHALLAVSEEQNLPGVLQSMNSWIGRRSQARLSEHGCSWQDGYRETRIRSSRQFSYVVNYIEGNPAQGGLAEARERWEWSSANPRLESLCLRPWPWSFEGDK